MVHTDSKYHIGREIFFNIARRHGATIVMSYCTIVTSYCTVASGLEIHMYLEFGTTQFLSFGLKDFGAWPEHINWVLYEC